MVVTVLAYLALMLVTIGSMLFGAEWMMQPVPRHHEVPAVHAVTAERQPQKPKPAPRAATQQPATTTAALADHDDAAGVATGTAVSVPPVPVTANSIPAPVTATAAPASAAPACDIRACDAAYQTFREFDCTYQPRNGPRRLCEKSTATASASNADEHSPFDAKAQQACDIDACSAAYRTFDPATCTYQPYDGPRRLCTK